GKGGRSRHPRPTEGAPPRRCHLSLNAVAKFSAWGELPARDLNVALELQAGKRIGSAGRAGTSMRTEGAPFAVRKLSVEIRSEFFLPSLTSHDRSLLLPYAATLHVHASAPAPDSAASSWRATGAT